MAKPVPDDEKALIVADLKAGRSQTSVAKKFGRASSTVNGIAKEAGLEYSGPKKANEARRDYAKSERLLLLNEVFDKARTMARGLTTPQELKDFSTALGILIDKRRLEDGEVTSRNETRDRDRDAAAAVERARSQLRSIAGGNRG